MKSEGSEPKLPINSPKPRYRRFRVTNDTGCDVNLFAPLTNEGICAFTHESTGTVTVLLERPCYDAFVKRSNLDPAADISDGNRWIKPVKVGETEGAWCVLSKKTKSAEGQFAEVQIQVGQTGENQIIVLDQPLRRRGYILK